MGSNTIVINRAWSLESHTYDRWCAYSIEEHRVQKKIVAKLKITVKQHYYEIQ